LVDSNENGFTEEDVQAICTTGQSSKKLSLGYIGEKGIGFKSVYKVASKVHIQSEPFSFGFEHKQRDSGMGMITPVNQPHAVLPDNVRTRITLELLESLDYTQLVKEFDDLPDTLVLFLKKIERFTINVHSRNGLSSSTTYSYEFDGPAQLVRLTKLVTRDGSETAEVKRYHITRKLLSGLPDDEARKGTNEAEVVLAFPLDCEHGPIIEQQKVFAFLPLRSVGFSVRKPPSVCAITSTNLSATSS
jgi:hypothetical protein